MTDTEHATLPQEEDHESLSLVNEIMEEVRGDDSVENERMGTTSSARFNILATMVGGGSLSLPMAFQKSGNLLGGPIFLIVMAVITEMCLRNIVNVARMVSPVASTTTTQGKDSFDSIAAAGFGHRIQTFTTFLVIAMCFFGCVGYAVLLRDMLEPVSHAIFHHDQQDWFHANAVMLTIILLVTPLCTLQTLTSLQRFGAASMCAILILGVCILFRSFECNVGLLDKDTTTTHEWQAFRLFPENWRDLLDAFPLFVSCYVCHYNVPTVHNELKQPSEKRVYWWLRSTTWSATIFYIILGIAGSAYAHCTETGRVQGNVLLDFDESDPLLLVGRLCLAVTITLAFPMLTIPARDIIIRAVPAVEAEADDYDDNLDEEVVAPSSAQTLEQPLLSDQDNMDSTDEGIESHEASDNDEEIVEIIEEPWPLRLLVVAMFLWTAVGLASCVSSIAVVWGFLGSSLSILLSFTIPCGSYVLIMREPFPQRPAGNKWVIVLSWILLLVSGPMIIISTLNTVYNMVYADYDFL